jgi:hypothetical protein
VCGCQGRGRDRAGRHEVSRTVVAVVGVIDRYIRLDILDLHTRFGKDALDLRGAEALARSRVAGRRARGPRLRQEGGTTSDDRERRRAVRSVVTVAVAVEIEELNHVVVIEKNQPTRASSRYYSIRHRSLPFVVTTRTSLTALLLLLCVFGLTVRPCQVRGITGLGFRLGHNIVIYLREPPHQRG